MRRITESVKDDFSTEYKTNRLLAKYGNYIKMTELSESVKRGLMADDDLNRIIKTNRVMEAKSPLHFSKEKKIMMAQTLENLQDRIRYVEATNPMAIGAYKKYAIDIANVITANLIAPELVGVHTLEGRNGIVRYFNFNYGRDKGATEKGRTFNSSLNLPMNDPLYGSKIVDGEEVKITAGAETSYVFKWAPIMLPTFSIKGTISGKTKILVADNFGRLMDEDGSEVGTVSPAGALHLVAGVFDEGVVSATYRYNNEVVRDDGPMEASFVNIPTADVEIGAVPVFADVYAMNATWSTMAEYDLMKETKMSMRDLLQTQIVGELQREIDNRIIGQLFDAADASAPVVWSEIPGVGVSPDAHYNGLRIELNKASKRIRQASGKYSANYIVAGTQACADIECITGFKSANTNQVPGSRLVGELPGGMKVYETTAMDEYDMMLGFKSNNAIEAGAFYCPYMPVTSLGMLQMGDMRNREGFATAYAFTIINSKLYQKGHIVNQ